MRSVREFVRRLNTLAESSDTTSMVGLNQRRIVVPEMGRFSMDGTLARTLPIESAAPFDHPGAPPQVVQLLEWLDVPDDGPGSAFRDNNLGVDIAAVLALATGRRVAFANEVPLRLEGVQWTVFLEVGPSVDGELYGPAEPGVHARFETAVRAIASLPEEDGLALGGAIRMRNAGCCLVETDHSSAYGLLVVALETLSRAFGDPPGTWQEWDQSEDWDGYFLQIGLTGQQAESLRARLLLNKQIRLKRTFVEYAVGNLPPSFWERSYYRYTPTLEMDPTGARRGGGSWNEGVQIAALVPQDPAELRRRLGKSYDTRSEVFHQSARLDQVTVMPVPGSARQPLPFAGLRRILDHLLWIEIEKGAREASELPDVQVLHPVEGQSASE